MLHEAPDIVTPTERLILWAPGTFSVVMLVLSAVLTPRFTGRVVELPAYYSLLFLGIFGVLVHGVLRRQQRRISALESVVLENKRSSPK